MTTLELPDYSSTYMDNIPATIYLSHVTKYDDNLYFAKIDAIDDHRMKIEDPDPIAFFRDIAGQSVNLTLNPVSTVAACKVDVTNPSTGNRTPFIFTCSDNLVHSLEHHVMFGSNLLLDLAEDVRLSVIPPSDTRIFEPWLARMRMNSEIGKADVMIKYVSHDYHPTFGRTISCEGVIPDEYGDNINNWASTEIHNGVGRYGIAGRTLRFTKDSQTPDRYLVTTVSAGVGDPERHYSMNKIMADQIQFAPLNRQSWAVGTIGLLDDPNED